MRDMHVTIYHRIKIISVITAKYSLRLVRGYSTSRQWFVRQEKDPFVRAARQQSYRSRAAFKLIEIDQKYNLIQNSRCIVDLGAAPGGWSQVLRERNQTAYIVALDLEEMSPMEGVNIVRGDFNDIKVRSLLIDTKNPTPDLVVSDMCPKLTGVSFTDHWAFVMLLQGIVSFSDRYLTTGGALIAKFFEGPHSKDLFAALKDRFSSVEWMKPRSSRKLSSEMYIIATGRKL